MAAPLEDGLTGITGSSILAETGRTDVQIMRPILPVTDLVYQSKIKLTCLSLFGKCFDYNMETRLKTGTFLVKLASKQRDFLFLSCRLCYNCLS